MTHFGENSTTDDIDMTLSFDEPTYFEQRTGVVLTDRELLQEAFTHRSYLNEVDVDLNHNERLEFLGDAVIELITSLRLFALFPDSSEGDLTRLRSMLVRRETLARVADTLHLGDYLLLGRGEEETGGRKRPATLCAVYEALAGAVYLDQGMEVATDFVLFTLKEDLAFVTQVSTNLDAKSRIQEYAQETFGLTPRYKTIRTTGPDHDRCFVVVVSVGKIRLGLGRGKSKRTAAQQAAAMALHRLGQFVREYDFEESLASEYELDDPDRLVRREE